MTNGSGAEARRSKTKIVATLGPASDGADKIGRLMTAGVDVFRLNMAHGTQEEQHARLETIRRVSRELDQPVGVLIDLAGPKIRLGELHTDPTRCEEGDRFAFVRGDSPQSRNELTSTYDKLIDEVSVGDDIMLADGLVRLIVRQKDTDRAECEVLAGGEIRSRQGINLPGVELSTPALTEKDIRDAHWAAEEKIDFVGLSFVRRVSDVEQLNDILSEHRSRALTIAKIEKPQALGRLDAIVKVSGGIMVARGDLGVEIDVADVPAAQKRIISTCLYYGKPVIVATQMLDSMQRSRRPTRAEVTDVATAISDGADACMLSGESAIGRYPVESVAMMNRVMISAEDLCLATGYRSREPSHGSHVHVVTKAVVYGSARIAERVDAAMVVIATRTGLTALTKSKQRDFIPTVGISNDPVVIRQMCLFWGITPLSGAPTDDRAAVIDFVESWGRAHNLIKSGDRIVIVTGSGLETVAHNLLFVHEVG